MRLHRSGLPLLVLLLAACAESPAPAPTTPAAPVAADGPPAKPTDDRVDGLRSRADAALADDRLFEPADDNALAWYLAALDAAAGDTPDEDARRGRRLSDALGQGDRQDQLRLALSDLFPYGLVWVERAIAANQRDEAERVLALLERAQPGAHSLRRLRDLLAQPAPATPAVATTGREAEPAPAPRPATTTSPAITSTEMPSPPAAQTGPMAAVPATTTAPPADEARGAAPDSAAEVAALADAPAPASATSAITPGLDAPARTQANGAALPAAITRVAPRYPPRAQRQRIEGWVLVDFVIQADGRVDDVRVLAAEPAGVFDTEAVGSMRRWRFQPPGQPVPAQRRIEFRLGEG